MLHTRCSISKLYVPETCVNTRQNNVGLPSLDPRYLRCSRIKKQPDEDQCNDVISERFCSLAVARTPFPLTCLLAIADLFCALARSAGLE